MKILFLAHRLPYPPNKGDKIRSYNELAYLAARHDVWCAAFVDDPQDLAHVDALRSMCRDVAAIPISRRKASLRGLASLLTGSTLTEAFYESRPMRRTLARWSENVNFDAVFAFSSSMADYALSIPADRHVIDFCDLDSIKWSQYANTARGFRRWLYGLEARRLRQKEIQWADQFDCTILITHHEAKPLIDQVGRRKVTVVGNGVTPEALSQDGDLPAALIAGFVGAMDYKPNIKAVQWFCQDIWPHVLALQPQAVFRIVGRNPTAPVKKLAALPGVEVVGAVTDLYPIIRQLRLSVAPLRIARGLQNKVLEAMALARPVVLTQAAACGIDAADNEHFLIADTPEEFAARVVYLLTDQDTARQIGTAARQYVAANHHWPTEMRKLEQALTGSTTTTFESPPLPEPAPLEMPA